MQEQNIKYTELNIVNSYGVAHLFSLNTIQFIVFTG
jgi:hypothetical protein